MKLPLHSPASLVALIAIAFCGCAFCPEKYQREQVHNPFPQIKRIAVLPFYNQSDEPTINTEMVADQYYAALQAIPGFEVLPVGVAKAQWIQYSRTNGEPTTGHQFQALAQQMGVEAIVVGSVTDFDSYYPPQMAITVHLYAANDGFHPIPNGYGLPWGTDKEDDIPARIVRDTEFDLARSQLATQTPLPAADHSPNASRATGQELAATRDIALTSGELPLNGFADSNVAVAEVDGIMQGEFHDDVSVLQGLSPLLPQYWPNPTDLIPDPPSPVRPVAIVNHEPILSHTRLYRGDDPYFTNRLANHIESGDDARPASWQGYLKRSDDFVHFCCHLHILEMLESRGGRDQSDLILRWPLSRY
ncbi:MAG: hypothetical protein ACR2NZ_12945 [Rubripirellula sp.]